MTASRRDDGTSAATPLWAALASQINTIFNDQGLPNLGYANDLLYIAAAIAPGGVQRHHLGQQHLVLRRCGGAVSPATATPITPTGYGYSAGPGYDLATGLGTPNGMLLARALTAIAHYADVVRHRARPCSMPTAPAGPAAPTRA